MLKTAAWVIICLVAIDVSINVLCAYPKDVTVEPSRLEQYFDYGRSVEAKVRRMVGPDQQTTHPIAAAGWFATSEPLFRPARADDLTFAVYGQSFTNHVCEALAIIEPRANFRFRSAPNAPLNYCYAQFLADDTKQDASVILVGIVAQALPALDTLTAMTWNFEIPATYTYPRYSVDGDRLSSQKPAITSLAQLRSALHDRTWDTFVEQLKEDDAFYDRFLFEQSVLDRSALVRLVRRAWGQRHYHRMMARYHDASGFHGDTDLVPTAQAILRRFVQQVRQNGQLPIFLLFNNLGYGDHLYRSLGPTLDELKVDYISTHEFAPAIDIANFLPDGHFVPSVRRETAERLRGILDRRLATGGDSPAASTGSP